MFACGPDGEFSNLAVEDETVAVRRLDLMRGGEGLLEGLRPFAMLGGDKERDLFVHNARVRVVDVTKLPQSSTDGLPALPTLHANLEKNLPNNSLSEVGSEEDKPQTITVLYDCWHEGEAVVELKLSIFGKEDDVCIRWKKVCRMGWDSLQVLHNSKTVLQNGVVQEDWSKSMQAEGTHETVMKLQLSSTGIQRLQPPAATSNHKLLKVEIRGPFYFGGSTFEVSSDPVHFSVIHICESDGLAEVVLTLEKAVLSDQHRPEKVQLTWKKLCGATEYKFLQVFIKSDLYQNKTQAVDGGYVLPGFMRPCPTSKMHGGGQTLGAPASNYQACGNEEPILEVPAKDTRTSLELRIDKEGALEPPTLQPPPDLSYDRRVLQVTIWYSPRSTVPRKSNHPARNLLQTLNVRYVCFKDGVSIVMVTLHVLAYKPIDLAWRKRCSEPKVRVGKVLTAPQAMVITIFVVCIVALICCLIFLLCGKGDADTNYDSMTSADLELPTRPASKRKPQPDLVGVPEEDAEFIYH